VSLPRLIPVLVLLLGLGSSALAIDDNLTKGATTTHVFEAGTWGEYIDTLNGGLNLSIPLGQEYLVSPDVSYRLQLSYSSKIWQLNESNFNQRSRARLQGRGQAGLGFSLQLGRLYMHSALADCTSKELVFEDSTGAPHPVDGGVTSDGSYLNFSLSGAGGSTVKTPGGVTYRMGNSVQDLLVEAGTPSTELEPSCIDTRLGRQLDSRTNDYRGDYVTAIEGKDTNGSGSYNWVHVEYENADGMRHLIKRITDSRGRVITFNNTREHPEFPGDPAHYLSLGYVKSISIPVFGGASATYTFHYVITDVHDPFVVELQDAGDYLNPLDPNNPDGIYENVLLLDSVEFPYGYQMKFRYQGPEGGTTFGFLRSRELPTRRVGGVRVPVVRFCARNVLQLY
jgi:hypothetical protein